MPVELTTCVHYIVDLHRTNSCRMVQNTPMVELTISGTSFNSSPATSHNATAANINVVKGTGTLSSSRSRAAERSAASGLAHRRQVIVTVRTATMTTLGLLAAVAGAAKSDP